MTKHTKAVVIDSLIGLLMRIKTLSASAEIDQLCIEGVNKLHRIVDADGLKEELDEIKKRRIDPFA